MDEHDSLNTATVPPGMSYLNRDVEALVFVACKTLKTEQQSSCGSCVLGIFLLLLVVREASGFAVLRPHHRKVYLAPDPAHRGWGQFAVSRLQTWHWCCSQVPLRDL